MLNRLIGRARVRICLAMALVVVFGAPASARAAYDMTISANATTNVTCSGGACTATGTPANLSAADLVNALGSGNVVLATGTGGSQAGDITVETTVTASSANTLVFQPQGGVTLGQSVVTGGNQVYQGPVTLTAPVTIATGVGDLATFDSTVDGQFALTVAGGADFAGPVGSVSQLSSLTVSGSATLGGGAVSTSGTQSYQGPVVLAASTTLAPGTSANFASTVDGRYGLTISGAATFGAAVGSTAALTNLSVSGAATLAGGAVSTSGTQSYQGPVVLAASTTLAPGTSANFASTVDGRYGLTISGAATFGAAVGSTAALTNLSVSGAATLAGGAVSTSGTQSYQGPVVLAASTTLAPGTSANFASTVDGFYDLTISGSATFGGPVGSTTQLQNLDVTGSSQLGGDITTASDQNYGGPVLIAGSVLLEGSGPSPLIVFGSTINGDGGATSLTVLTQGSVGFTGAVGGVTPIGTLFVEGSPQEIDLGGDVSVGSANLVGPVVLDSDVTLSVAAAGSFVVNGAVSGSGHTLIASGQGIVELTGGAGSYGSTIVRGGTLSFAGAALGTGPVTLDGGTLDWAGPSPLQDVSAQGLLVTSNGGTLLTNGQSLTLASGVGGSGTLKTDTSSGTLTLSGSGSYGGAIDELSGTIDVTGSIDTPITVERGASLNVPAGGTLSGAVEVAGALNCENGTIAGPVTTDGGTLQGAPGAPTVTGVTPGVGLATVAFTPGAINCNPVVYRATASPGGEASGSLGGGPLTVSGLTAGVSYTFGVIATNALGSTASVPLSPGSFTVAAAAPSVRVSSPTSGATYAVGQTVTAAYSCQDGLGGPGIASCSGSVVSGAAIDTQTPGIHTFTVTALSSDGQSATTTVEYTVAAPPSSSVTAPSSGQSATTTVKPTVAAAPSISVTTPSDGATYPLGRAVTAQYGCQDGIGGPGISSCVGSVPTGMLLNTKTVGVHSFAVTATSGDGQTATVTVRYTVTEPPIVLRSRPRVTRRGIVEFVVSVPCAGTVRVIEFARGARTVTRTLRNSGPRTLRVRLRWLRRRHGMVPLRVIRVRIVYLPLGGHPETKVLALRHR